MRHPSAAAGVIEALERINQFKLYKLAADLREIPGYGESLGPNLRYKLVTAKAALVLFCRLDAPIGLTMSLNSAKDVLKEIDAVLAKISEVSPRGIGLAQSNEDEQEIASWQLLDVRAAIEKFEVLLSAECEARPAFVAPKRGVYDTEELVNAAANAIPPSLQPMMSAQAIDDLGSAGRCLAFGLFTAAGFHMCRAVEAVLEAYYQRFTGKAGTLHSWYDYIDALEKSITAQHNPTAEKQTLAYLDQLRSSSRNPIMHPRVVLDEADAFEIFNLGCGIINRMAQELQAASKPARKRKPRGR